MDVQGNTASMSYDLTTDPQAPSATVTNQVGASSTLTFDSRGNQTSQQIVNGPQTELMQDVYADPNNPDLPTSETQVGSGGNLTTNYSYDDLGDVVSEQEPLANTTLYSYNAAGQVTSVTDPLGNTTQYMYDIGAVSASGQSPEPGNMLAIVDPQNNASFYQYDGEGNPTKITSGAQYNNFLGYDLMYAGYLDANYGVGSGSGSGSASAQILPGSR